MPSGLYVPAVAAPSFSAVQREMPGAANCWISTSSPTRWRRPVQGHHVDCCWKGVPLAAVIAANQLLYQFNAERLQVHSHPAPSWPALPCQDEGVGDAAVYEEPKDVPVVSKSTYITVVEHKNTRLVLLSCMCEYAVIVFMCSTLQYHIILLLFISL